MANQEFVDHQWNSLVKDLIGDTPRHDKSATAQGYWNSLTRWSNTKSKLNNRFYADEDIAGVRNTKWGALMAVQAWEQKDKPLKGIQSVRDRTRRHQANVIFGKLPMTEKAAKILVEA